MGFLKPAWMKKMPAHNQVYIDKVKQSIDKEKNQLTLAEIVRTAPEYEAYTYAIKLITDQAILEDLAVNCNRPRVREGAVSKLTNQTLLADYAKNDPDVDVRMAAVRVLTDMDSLEDIGRTNSEYYIREAALLRHFGCANSIELIEKLTDLPILTDIAKNDAGVRYRHKAEVKLFILIGPTQHCENHHWKKLDCCLKKCTICGTLEYDHKYKYYDSYDNGFVRSSKFKCEHCGHRGESRDSMNENDSYDTGEYGLIKR
ncbi:hypothetical protein LJC56_08630 [Christensenellaceae bacterium OttesenSCG-928-K19]|nr:hypothetical protein [Christensenellaceae bacterium OttesenSCG-928-K19]